MRLKETTTTEVQERLLTRLELLFGKDAYQIVELNYAMLKHRAQFRVVLFHPAGVSLDTCAELHRVISVEIDRLQASGLKISDNNDYSLELSSPGLGRQLRSRREFQVFRGQVVRCMSADCWYSGVLLGLSGTAAADLELSMEVDAEVLRLPLEQVQKVELDS